MLKKLSKNAKITLSILFIIIGLVLISYNYFAGIKNNVFNDRNIKLMETIIAINEEIDEVNDDENIIVSDEVEENEEAEQVQEQEVVDSKPTNEDRKDNYIGYLEVPDVNIKRGFVSLGSKYNSVGYNVMLIEGSDMPDHKNGNLILAAHRGNSSVSFFDKLYLLEDGAIAYINYQGKRYKYELKTRYYEEKDGSINIIRNANVNVLTLITCTRNDKKTQTVFIFELVSVE